MRCVDDVFAGIFFLRLVRLKATETQEGRFRAFE